MINITNLGCKLDKSKYLFRNISFTLPQGDTLLIVGQSGSGKTTLLKVISGLIRQDEGDILYDGVDVNNISYSGKNIGMVFQNNALFDNMTADENIMFPLKYLLNKTEHEAQKITMDLIEKLNLGDIAGKEIKALSGGMRKRVAIARAISTKPKYIFFDEPLQGLDPVSSKKIVDLFFEIKKQYLPTIIIISNEVKFFLNLTDRVGFLDNEKMILYNSKNEFLNSNDGYCEKFLTLLKGIG